MVKYSLQERQPGKLITGLVAGYLAFLGFFYSYDYNTQRAEREEVYRKALKIADQEGNGDGITSDKELKEFCKKRGLPFYSQLKPSTSENMGPFLDGIEQETRGMK